MRFLATFFLVFFIGFLTTPTVVGMLTDDVDVSLAYTSAEEELDDEVKEILFVNTLKLHTYFAFKTQKKMAILQKNLLKHHNILEDIFLPPPELV